MTFLLMGFCYPCFFMYLERKKKKEGKLVIFLVAKVKKSGKKGGRCILAHSYRDTVHHGRHGRGGMKAGAACSCENGSLLTSG